MHMGVEIRISHPEKSGLLGKTEDLFMSDSKKGALYLTTKVTGVSAPEHKKRVNKKPWREFPPGYFRLLIIPPIIYIFGNMHSANFLK